MTQNQSIVFDALQRAGTNPEQVYFNNAFPLRKYYGWFALMEDGSVYQLGARVDSALYNIEHGKIKKIVDC
jgi:hypothetical protein